ncbi:MAG: hypothetical protein ACKVOU_15425 [Cytophagales bacterium]
MKTNNTNLVITLILALTIFSCSKKITSHNNNDTYKMYSQQLEMDYVPENTQITASANEEITPLVAVDTRFENASNVKSKTILENKHFKKGTTILERIDNKVSNDIISTNALKIKDQKSAEADKVVSGKLKTGIIIGAVGLALLITAGFFGAAAPIVYVIGAVMFIIGVVLILLDIL